MNKLHIVASKQSGVELFGVGIDGSSEFGILWTRSSSPPVAEMLIRQSGSPALEGQSWRSLIPMQYADVHYTIGC